MTPSSLAETALPSIVAPVPELSIETQQSHEGQPLVVRGGRSGKHRKRRGGERNKKLRKSKPLNDWQRDQLADLARDIAAGHREFEQWLMATAARAIQIGQLGFKAKNIAGHGHFGEWKENLRTQYGIAERSLERYMYLFKNRRKLVALMADGAELADGAADNVAASLQSVKLQDALDFLERSAKPAVKKAAARPRAIAISPPRVMPDSVLEIACELLGFLDFVVCDHTWRFSEQQVQRVLAANDADFNLPDQWRGRGLIHSDEPDFCSVLALAKQMYESGPLESALLLVPAITDHPALEMFYSCPRAFFRKRLSFAADEGGQKTAGHAYMLIFLGPADGTADFHYAAGGEADVYVPYVA